MSEPIYFSTNSHPISNPSTQIMRVDLDGGFTVNESIPATDAAKEVLRIMKEQWFADPQATKIRELQSDVTQLENRLRALWDKLEYERKHYMEQINRTESFINRFLDPEDLGYAVNNYVRDDAREALGRERVESNP